MTASAPLDPPRFVFDNTRVTTAPLVPEIPLFLADEVVPLWHLTEETLLEHGLPPPFWAFAWAGGQAVARHVLDNPGLVRGKRVLDFAAGSGLVGIAAARAGAASVTCADIDPFSAAACEMNAGLNALKIKTTTDNLIGQAVEADVILAGDICYEKPLAAQVAAWLGRLSGEGRLVLLGDPGRTYLPGSGLEALATYCVETSRELEDNDVRRTVVYKVLSL